MTSTLITQDELKDLDAAELQSKFFKVSGDVARMRQQAEALPLAEASLRNISRELTLRRLKGPWP
ncbi:MAG: hypothetical protein SFV18_17570 [Bryobacteraceae bacterium]|nr:hypothetical protein [Bryobacteraceae bacterium]